MKYFLAILILILTFSCSNGTVDGDKYEISLKLKSTEIPIVYNATFITFDSDVSLYSYNNESGLTEKRRYYINEIEYFTVKKLIEK